jgi:hypothetical protein
MGAEGQERVMTTYTPHCCIGVNTGGEMCPGTTIVADYYVCAKHAPLLEAHGSLAEALASLQQSNEGGAV